MIILYKVINTIFCLYIDDKIYSIMNVTEYTYITWELTSEVMTPEMHIVKKDIFTFLLFTYFPPLITDTLLMKNICKYSHQASKYVISPIGFPGIY